MRCDAYQIYTLFRKLPEYSAYVLGLQRARAGVLAVLVSAAQQAASKGGLSAGMAKGF
jgi:hypothetical protein